MKRLFLLSLLVVMTQQVQTQTGIAGYWRAVSVVPDETPDGTLLQFTMDLNVDGASVTGIVTGAPLVIAEGRLDGTSLTLNGVDTSTKQPISLTGNLSGGEIVFRAVGLSPEPIHLIARRVVRDDITGSISDAALMQQLLKRFSVRSVAPNGRRASRSSPASASPVKRSSFGSTCSNET